MRIQKKPLRTTVLRFRCFKKDANRIRLLANTYAAGNMSRWIVYGALEAPRKRLK